MFAQTSSVAHPATQSPASDDTRDPLPVERATSVRILLTLSATLIVTAAIVAASFVVYNADGPQLDAHNLAHLRLLLTLVSAAGIGAGAALAALLAGRTHAADGSHRYIIGHQSRCDRRLGLRGDRCALIPRSDVGRGIRSRARRPSPRPSPSRHRGLRIPARPPMRMTAVGQAEILHIGSTSGVLG